MKKVLLLVVALGMFVSCTPTSLEENEPQATEKQKVCPPSNPNC